MADFVEWSDELSVGIEEIDAQHRILANLINKMHRAIHERQGNEVVREVLAELSDYTRIHFAVEESLMRILGYPGYEEHHELHQQLLEQVIELQAKVDQGTASVSFELMHFLKVWLTRHIMEEDRSYSGFFLAAGARPKLKKRSWVSRLWGS